jgi:prefoldin subunit 5
MHDIEELKATIDALRQLVQAQERALDARDKHIADLRSIIHTLESRKK